MRRRGREFDHVVSVLSEVCGRYEAIIDELLPRVPEDARLDAAAQLQATVDLLASAVEEEEARRG